MKFEVISLKDLPEHWQKITQTAKTVENSTNPLVDGTSMTVNPDIKYRRKRIISQQTYKTKRPHIAEFINACRFLAGETSKVFPLSIQHQNILSLVRNNKEIPEHYQSVVNHNIDLVKKAAQLKPKEIKEKYCTMQIKEKETEQMQRKVNAQNVRISEQAGNKFKEWLLNNLSDIPFEEKQEDMRYSAIVSYYKNHDGQVQDYMPKSSKAILDKYSNDLCNYITSKNRLKRVNNKDVNKTNDIDSTQNSSTAVAAVSTNPVRTDMPDCQPSKWSSAESTVSVVEQKSKIDDTLSMIIMLAKNAGASELIIKL